MKGVLKCSHLRLIRVCSAVQGAEQKLHMKLMFTFAQLLLDRGADVHAVGDQALRWACQSGEPNLVNWLIGAGADVHTLSDEPLRCAQVVDVLDARRNFLRPAWISCDCRLSASLGDLATVRQLLAAGADVSAQGGSALQLARQAGHSEVAEELERASAAAYCTKS